MGMMKTDRIASALKHKSILSRGRVTYVLTRIVLYLLLINMAFIFLYPFLYMVVMSLKSYSDLIDSSVTWILNSFHYQNYVIAYEVLDYGPKLLNSVFVTVLATAGHIFSCSLAGYAFARYQYKYVKRLFLLVIMAMVIPIQTLIIPIYMFFSRTGMLNTYIPLILPTFFGYGLKGALFIFLYRQFYLSLPKSLEEAASIDGCGPIRTYLRIAFPSASSSTLVCVVLSMVWHFNDFFEPSMYIRRQEKYLLPQTLPSIYNLLEQMAQKPGGTGLQVSLADIKEVYNYALVMASAVLVILPLIIAYFIMQRWFMEGIERSGITGE